MTTELLKNIEIILRSSEEGELNFSEQELIEKLEDALHILNAAANKGEELVPDAIYDTLIERLRSLDSSNPLLHHVWSESETDDYGKLDSWLQIYPMMSIQTIKAFTNRVYINFRKSISSYGTVLRFVATLKINGHAVRAVWEYGELVLATSRGRGTAGKDLTSQMRVILGAHNSSFSHIPLVEVRGEVAMTFDNFERAKEFNPDVKSAFTAVSSMIRASASDEEVKLLDFLAYEVLYEGSAFSHLSEKYDYLESCGFKIPLGMVFKTDSANLDNKLQDLLLKLEKYVESYEYYTDGVVIQVDDYTLFNALGAEDKFRYGNIALKMGYWEQNTYVGYVGEVVWEQGKTKLTPVILLREKVLTATGASPSRIPVYTPANLLTLNAYTEGSPIHFKFGGESGVVPCYPDGRLLKEVEDENSNKSTGAIINVDGSNYIVYNDDEEEGAEMFSHL